MQVSVQKLPRLRTLARLPFASLRVICLLLIRTAKTKQVANKGAATSAHEADELDEPQQADEARRTQALRGGAAHEGADDFHGYAGDEVDEEPGAQVVPRDLPVPPRVKSFAAKQAALQSSTSTEKSAGER